MMRSTLFLLGALLCACSESKPAADPQIEEIIASQPGMTRTCRQKLRNGSLHWSDFDRPDCYEMLPARTWKGRWDLGFEWTNFSCPAPSRDCPISAKDGDVWLVFGKDTFTSPGPSDGTYEIQFVGRRTRVRGHFGHLGQYEHLMVVDRLISLRKVEEQQ